MGWSMSNPPRSGAISKWVWRSVAFALVLLVLLLPVTIILRGSGLMSQPPGRRTSAGAGTTAGESQPVHASRPVVFLSGVLLPEMVFIEGGEFLMGSPVSDTASAEYHEEERPQRLVRVESFYLSRFLVTAEQYCQFLNECGDHEYVKLYWETTVQLVDGRYQPAEFCDRSPATDVNWVGANAYCDWLSEKTGRGYRLPTEAEWEYAARGVELRPWPWGSESPPTAKEEERPGYRTMPFFKKYGPKWHSDARRYGDPLPGDPVGSYPRNRTPQGVYDMLGYYGAYEAQWCSDAYEPPSPLDRENPEPFRAVRGCWKRRANPAWIESQRTRLGLLETAHNIVGETMVDEEHAGRSWSRDGRRERSQWALVRIAMDTDAPP